MRCKLGFHKAGGGALECNLTGGAHFLRISTTRLGKNCTSIPCFGIFRLQNSRETIAFCSSTHNQNPFRNFWWIFIPGSGIYAEKWYPEERHVPYRFIWKCAPLGHKANFDHEKGQFWAKTKQSVERMTSQTQLLCFLHHGRVCSKWKPGFNFKPLILC